MCFKKEIYHDSVSSLTLYQYIQSQLEIKLESGKTLDEKLMTRPFSAHKTLLQVQNQT